MPGENSSSPNGNFLTVLGIRKRGTKGGRYELDLSDGSSFFVPGRILSAFGVTVGSQLDPNRLAELKLTAEKADALERAVTLLARRDHSTEELRKKLVLRDFGPAAVAYALDRLAETGYLDNRKFAEEWITSRLTRHPEGRTRLYAGLLQRGVSRADAEAALSRVLDEETLREAALRAAEKLSRRSSSSPEMMKNRLYVLGFTAGEIAYALRRLESGA